MKHVRKDCRVVTMIWIFLQSVKRAEQESKKGNLRITGNTGIKQENQEENGKEISIEKCKAD